jgi:hypothetical protein
MVPAVTTLQGVNVIISWVAPNSGSLAIVSYKIEILSSDGLTFKQTSTCNGEDSMIKTNLFCTVPMKTLTQYPFNLQVYELI